MLSNVGGMRKYPIVVSKHGYNVEAFGKVKRNNLVRFEEVNVSNPMECVDL